MTTKTTVTIACTAVLLAAGVVALSRTMTGSGYVPERVRTMQVKAEAGDAEAQLELGNAYYSGDGVLQDVDRALHWWRAAAEKGNVVAQLNLGTASMSLGENGVKEAVKWLTKAAEAGDEGAQRNLGLLYLTGNGVGQNLRKAAVWLHRSAAQGDATAQYNLAVMFENGQGVVKDLPEARRWFERAARGGHPGAIAWMQREESKQD